MNAIDWGLAQRIGEMVAGSPPRANIAERDLNLVVGDFARRISSYAGLELHGELPGVEVLDRPRWIAANLKTMRPLLEPLTDQLPGGSQGPFSSTVRAASGSLLGAQVGALTGMLSQRVLGQYDVALLDPSVEPRLLLVAPNLAAAASSLALSQSELIEWVTIHEITHAVQFTGAPWLRGHLGGLIEELMQSMQIAELSHQLPNLRAFARGGDLRGELREMASRARAGEILRVTIGEERWKLVDRIQATMTLIEGHAEHVMDAVGAEVLPSLPRLRSAMTRRRESRGLPWRVLERLLGLELKMRQYRVGRRFCDAVVERAGPGGLAPAWRSVEGLPSTAELEKPQLWLDRTRVPPLQAPPSHT